MQRLDTIPGVGRQTAEVLVAEVGTELARFPSAAHLASWAGMCPGNHESAGKHRGGRTRKGSKWLRRALIEAACGAVRTKQAGRTALAGHYRRLVARRGRQKAIVAVGHRLLIIVYHVLRDGQSYQEPTPTDLDQRRRRRARDRAMAQLRHLGYDVTVTPIPAAA
jgi:transposase